MTANNKTVFQNMGSRTTRQTKEMLALCSGNSFVVFDRESTHFQPNIRYGKIIELSAVKIVDGVIVDTFDKLVNPEIKISANVEKLTGITNDMVKDAPLYPEVIMSFIKFCKGSTLVAHNAGSDIRYLEYFAAQLGLNFSQPIIDTINLCRWAYKKGLIHVDIESLKLSDITKAYGINNTSSHRALSDAIATSEVFLLMRNLLKDEIKHSSDRLSLLDSTTETKEGVDEESHEEALIGSIKYWEKEVAKKKFQRIYVRLILNSKINEIYYDFVTKKWGVKHIEFNMDGFDCMTKKLQDYLGPNNKDSVYKIETYKKGQNDDNHRRKDF